MRFLTTSDLVELHGNKRVGHAAMETLLVLNGYEMDAGSQEQEQVIIAVAAGQMGREDFTRWVQAHVKARQAP